MLLKLFHQKGLNITSKSINFPSMLPIHAEIYQHNSHDLPGIHFRTLIHYVVEISQDGCFSKKYAKFRIDIIQGNVNQV